MRTFSKDRSTGRLLDSGNRRRMVAMGMRHKNMRDGFVPHGIQQCADMPWIVRTRVDDRDLPSPNDVADRALERERTRIVRHDPTHARHGFVNHIGCEVEIFVERNVFAHSWSPDCRAGLSPIRPSSLPGNCGIRVVSVDFRLGDSPEWRKEVEIATFVGLADMFRVERTVASRIARFWRFPNGATT